jgi:uracil-DNA glycosylase
MPLLSIVHCQNLTHCMANPTDINPCSAIVGWQKMHGFIPHQIPEPWSGKIETAPILFVSSNPSISQEEDYPFIGTDSTQTTNPWTNGEIEDFFTNRFSKKWIQNGVRVLNKDGTYSKVVRYNAQVRKYAHDLLGRIAVPGEDYAFTEVVHCKSRGEFGVVKASKICAEKYLQPILAKSGARLIVVLGKVARNLVSGLLSLDANETWHPNGSDVSKGKPVVSTGIPVVMVPHPNARGPKSLDKFFSEETLSSIRQVFV